MFYTFFFITVLNADLHGYKLRQLESKTRIVRARIARAHCRAELIRGKKKPAEGQRDVIEKQKEKRPKGKASTPVL